MSVSGSISLSPLWAACRASDLTGRVQDLRRRRRARGLCRRDRRVWGELHPGGGGQDLPAARVGRCSGTALARFRATRRVWWRSISTGCIPWTAQDRAAPERTTPAELPALQVCIQVNIDGGLTKSGVAPAQALELVQAVAALPRLRLRGLMCIPEPAPDFVAACTAFARAKSLFDHAIRQD